MRSCSKSDVVFGPCRSGPAGVDRSVRSSRAFASAARSPFPGYVVVRVYSSLVPLLPRALALPFRTPTSDVPFELVRASNASPRPRRPISKSL